MHEANTLPRRLGAQRREQPRKTAARGYGSRWQRYRRSFLAQYPLCGMAPEDAPATQDSLCAARGFYTSAKDVDHIRPHRGPDDPLFWLATNHRALCVSCHRAKTRREQLRSLSLVFK